jgi:hypothetical protein
MDGLMASPASNQRFALPSRHQPEPGRDRLAPTAIEIGHLSEMVNLHSDNTPTQLALIGLQPLE